MFGILYGSQVNIIETCFILFKIRYIENNETFKISIIYDYIYDIINHSKIFVK